MKKIVFLAPFPSETNTREGMMQRVDAIDKLFDTCEYHKIYVVPRLKTLRTSRNEILPNIIELRISIWTSFFLLIRLLKDADIVYSHSLYGMSISAFLFLRLLRKKNFVWDVHGIIPEEIKLAGLGKVKQFVYNRLERAAFKNTKKIVVVTNAMSDHFRRKYPWSDARFLVYPILPLTISADLVIPSQGQTTVNLLYAGNMQPYQNIPKMIDSIRKIVDTPNTHFYILTGQKQQMTDLFRSQGLIDRKNITIDSVNPSQLGEYYAKAHYGYVLRDDVDVNNVACPTKIVEYLAYGMTCITLSNRIGDFERMGIESIHVDQLASSNLIGVKSLKNNDIYRMMASQNTPAKLKAFILSPI